MRILLVEDDSGVAGSIVKGLTEEGYAVDLSADGEEGYVMANAIPYDLRSTAYRSSVNPLTINPATPESSSTNRILMIALARNLSFLVTFRNA